MNVALEKSVDLVSHRTKMDEYAHHPLWAALRSGMEDLMEILVDRFPLIMRSMLSIATETEWQDMVLAKIPLSLRAEIATAVGLEEFSWRGLSDWGKRLTAAAVIAKNYPDFDQRKEVVGEFISCADGGINIETRRNLRQVIGHYREADDHVGILATRAVVYLMTAKNPTEDLIKILRELSAEDLGTIRGFVALADVLANHGPGSFYLEEAQYVRDDIGAMGARAVIYAQNHLNDAVEVLILVFRQLSADGLTKFKATFDSEREEAKILLEEV